MAAAHGYFGVSPRRLSWGEATMLAGLPQAPSAYDPLRHWAMARERQRHVLDQLVDNGEMSQGRATAVFQESAPLLRRMLSINESRWRLARKTGSASK
jgi:membrane peptidoglycan carboxypeptidase